VILGVQGDSIAQDKSTNPGDSAPAHQGVAGQKRLDINQVSGKELSRLPGMTPDVVNRVIENRPYKKLDDLVTRKIVGKKQFALIKEHIRIGPPAGR
jgi:DNA uptake protein ComE-like DNA-binding protein